MWHNLHIPNYLTLSRLVVAPAILPLLLAYLLPLNIFSLNLLLALCFGLFGFTDFLDGYLARKHANESLLGQLLDPIADKFLVTTALIALLAAQKIWFLWVIILICREIFVTGLRLFAQHLGQTITVSWWGKIKTGLQYLTIMFVILNPDQSQSLQISIWNSGELFLLLVTIVISLYSAYKYYSGVAGQIDFWKHKDA